MSSELEKDLATMICGECLEVPPGFREAWERVAKVARLGAAVEANGVCVVMNRERSASPNEGDHIDSVYLKESTAATYCEQRQAATTRYTWSVEQFDVETK